MRRKTFTRKPAGAPELTARDREAIMFRISERVVPVVATAVEVLGREKAIEWLNAPAPALDNQVPLQLLLTSDGAAQVEEALRALVSTDSSAPAGMSDTA